ncbi:MAG: hypothetical protein IJ379_14250, partial [Lachnospiraceae bacterium]|nr:hypothetical protein [Lachnospiraceae bacterium]
MEFTSILDLRKSPYKGDTRPGFLTDLNLNQIIERICVLWGADVREYYDYLPADKECEDYRRAVMQDVKKGTLYAELMRFVKKMGEYKECCANKGKVRMDLQKAAWQVKEVVQYGEALQMLQNSLEKAQISSQGMQALKEHLQNYLTSQEFIKMYQEAVALSTQMGSFRFRLTYENNLVILTEEEGLGAYEDFLHDSFYGQEKRMKSPFSNTLELNSLEQEVLLILQKKKPEFFKALTEFYKKYMVYAKQELIDLSAEMTYYLSYYKFEQKMQELGFAFTMPSCNREQEMFATGLYDLALACVNSQEQKEVTANDMVYHESEQFLVVTGPNQGGKTTFARSLGQLIYFCKMGLDVPALAANVHWFAYILTHFSV